VTGAHPFVFSGMENIGGGTADDRYVLSGNGAGLAGDLTDEDGDDTLDYALRTQSVTVDLGQQTGTAFGGQVSGIENFIGSTATDTLIGPDVSNTWTIAGSNAGTLSTAGDFTSFENLTGGTAGDLFVLDATASVSGTIDGGGGEGYNRMEIGTGGLPDTVSLVSGLVTRNGGTTNFARLDEISLDTGAGADQVTVSLSTVNFPGVVNITTGDDDDQVTVNLSTDAETVVRVDGGAGTSDDVRLNGTASDDVVSINGMMVSANLSTIELMAVENLSVFTSDGDDQISLTGTHRRRSRRPGRPSRRRPRNHRLSSRHGQLDGRRRQRDRGRAARDVVGCGRGGNAAIRFDRGERPADGGLQRLRERWIWTSRGGENDVTIVGTHAGSTSIRSGDDDDTVTILATSGELAVATAAGDDQVYVQSIGAAATLDLGDDDDLVHVSSVAPATTGGTVNGIGAVLSIEGGGGANRLDLDETGDATPNSGRLDSFELTGLGMTGGIAYQSIGEINIALGDGGNTFAVNVSHSATIDLDSGAGSDTVTIEAAGGPLTLDTRQGDDTVRVRSIDAPVTILLGDDDDTVHVSSDSPAAGTLNFIGDLLTIDGQGGQNTLHADDRTETNPKTGTLTDQQLTGLGLPEGIAYANFNELNISLGAGDDEFRIESTSSATTV
jgi:hypothetical protein